MELVLGTNRAFIQPGNQPSQDQSRETTGWGREKGGWQAVNGTKRESEGVVYMTLKKLCARDCLCSSTQLQMSPGFLPLPLSPPFSPASNSLSLSHSYFHPFLSSSLSFCLSWMKRNLCDRVWPPIQADHTCALTKTETQFDQTKGCWGEIFAP